MATHDITAIHPFEVEVSQVGLTVRRGDKWFKSAHPGDVVNLVQQDSEDRSKTVKVGTGRVVDVRLIRFNQLLASVIEQEHEVSSRQYTGLLESMRRAYGDGFSPTEFVTLLFYRRDT